MSSQNRALRKTISQRSQDLMEKPEQLQQDLKKTAAKILIGKKKYDLISPERKNAPLVAH